MIIESALPIKINISVMVFTFHFEFENRSIFWAAHGKSGVNPAQNFAEHVSGGRRTTPLGEVEVHRRVRSAHSAQNRS